MTLSPYQSKLFAHQLERSYTSDHAGQLAGLLFDAQVEPKPHQIDAALFALKNTHRNGVILADEVGLGKTIEAGIVISQYWAERKQRILIIAPASLRQQWQQELMEKFAIPSQLLDKDNFEKLTKPAAIPLVLICSYEFASKRYKHLTREWNLVICDEAHRLRSYYQSKAKIAKNIAEICRKSQKTVMLTATPLQNRLEELYGLVSVFDPQYFHSLKAFRARYVGYGGALVDEELIPRVARIARRTLRKDARQYVRFTERTAMTFAFEPSLEELSLHDQVEKFLKSQVYTFKKAQLHLSAMIVRKRLGSSSFAIASTLENIAVRLEEELEEGRSRNDAGKFIALDADITSDILEAADLDPDEVNEMSAVEREGIALEIAQIRSLAKFARSIDVNQKAFKLIEALEQGFEKLEEIGAPQKAIIFTDSSVTQNYIASVLREYGWGDRLVLFNGQNNSPEAKNIYKRWLEKNAGSDVITGVESADTRKALVDEFRDIGTIMIATEAAAEGINLQFCSMLVNYDLPWNPQRIEQRIGRVHRFGQKHNVVVINFSNQGNPVEKHILNILTNKFGLFSTVFGSSDHVLGAIEDGLDFEKQIHNILDTCKTEEEIEQRFEELEEKYSDVIAEEMSNTRSKVFDHLDPKVQDKLKDYDTQASVTLNAFERLLTGITRYELQGHAEFTNNSANFELLQAPELGIPTGKYYFKSTPEAGAHQYRYNSRLAQWVLDSAKASNTPDAALTFSVDKSDRVSALARNLQGKSGQLRVDEISYDFTMGSSPAREKYLVYSAMTDNGNKLDAEEITDLFHLNCVDIQPAAINDDVFVEDLGAQIEALNAEVLERNSGFLLDLEREVEERLADLEAEHRESLNKLEEQNQELKKQSRRAASAQDKLARRRESRKISKQIESLEEDYKQRRRAEQEKSDAYLDQAADALETEHIRTPLFSVTWKVI